MNSIDELVLLVENHDDFESVSSEVIDYFAQFTSYKVSPLSNKEPNSDLLKQKFELMTGNTLSYSEVNVLAHNLVRIAYQNRKKHQF